jgi:hypothetical protein
VHRQNGCATGINEIWEFIAADNLGAADRILEELR